MALALLGTAPGCETDDPCALRTAACVDVVLIGKRDDGAGNPISYRGLKVSVYAPNRAGMQSAPPEDHCEVTMVGTKMVRRVYGSDLGPVGTLLGSSDVPELRLKETNSPTIQAKLSFLLPSDFNAQPDPNADPDNQLDADLAKLPSDKARIDRLKQLRDSDARAVRILVTQSGQSKSAWDSRCEENVFSDDEWLMKKYYRVGQNQYAGVWAVLDGAQTTSP